MKTDKIISAVIAMVMFISCFTPVFAAEQIVVLTDPVDDLSKIYSFSDPLQLKLDTSSVNYVGDGSRLVRNGNTKESILYKTNSDISGFCITTYFHPSDRTREVEFLIYTSFNGDTFELCYPEKNIVFSGNEQNWDRHVYTISGMKPEIRYIKIEFSDNTTYSWAPQIGKVELNVNQTAGQTAAFETLTGDTSILKDVIEEATRVLNNAVEGSQLGQYETGSKDELSRAISAAQAFSNTVTPEILQYDIAYAAKILEAEIERFRRRVITTGDPSLLGEVIADADERIRQAVEGNEEGNYPAGSIDTLQNTVDSAQAVYENAAAKTYLELNNAVLELTNAIAAFEAVKIVEAPTQFETYITRNGDKLMDGNNELRFFSFNIPTLTINQQPSWKTPGGENKLRRVDPWEQEDAMKTICQLGGQVARTYVFSIIGGTLSKDVAHITDVGQYNEALFEDFDRLLSYANKYGVRLIIPLIDQWDHWGGIKQFAELHGKSQDSFFTDEAIKEDFKKFISTVLNRTNTITGVKYKDDKAILAWETGNELSPPDNWTEEMAEYIKRIDRVHLVMDGNYGISDSSLKNPNIDIVSNHYYDSDKTFSERYLLDASKAKGRKPFIVGEFGLSTQSNMQELITTVRDNGTTGALIWALGTHSVDGGFLQESYHWPAQNDSEEIMVDFMRESAYKIQGKPVPELAAPEKPEILPIEYHLEIAWKGSAGAYYYDLERSEAMDGPWIKIAENLREGIGAEYKPYGDTIVERGRSYYYRLIAKNKSGASSEPSDVKSYTVIHMNDTRKLEKSIQNAIDKYMNSTEGSELGQYEIGSRALLETAIDCAQTVLLNVDDLSQQEVDRTVGELEKAVAIFDDSIITEYRILINDEFDNYDKIYLKSEQLTIASDSSPYVPDTKRLARTAGTSEYVIYKSDDPIVKFSVNAYYQPEAGIQNMKFYISEDGDTYAEYSPEMANYGGNWANIIFSGENLPPRTHYLKMEFNRESTTNYTPQIAGIKIYGNRSSTPLEKLEAKIFEAEEKCQSAREGYGIGDFTAGAIAKLQEKIAAAYGVLNAGSSEEEINATLQALDAAVAAFEARRIAEELLISDEFQDLSKVFSAVNFEVTAPDNTYIPVDEPNTIVRRDNTTEAAIVYKTDRRLQKFQAQAYFTYDDNYDLKFFVSGDGVNYSSITPASSITEGNATVWTRLDYESTELPDGTKYLKILHPGNAKYLWTPQISWVKLYTARINVAALEEAIISATAKHAAAEEGTAPGQYPAEAKIQLKAAIDMAQRVLDDSDEKSQEEVNNAVQALESAMEAFEAAKIPERITYSIAISGQPVFREINEGYLPIEAARVAIEKTGIGDILNLSVALENGNAFIVGPPAATTLNAEHSSTTFTIKPKDGLKPGSYSDKVIIRADHGVYESFDINFKVNKVPSQNNNGENDREMPDKQSMESTGENTFPTAEAVAGKKTMKLKMIVDGKNKKAVVSLNSEMLARLYDMAVLDREGIKIIEIIVPEINNADSYSMKIPALRLPEKELKGKLIFRTPVGTVKMPVNSGMDDIEGKDAEITIAKLGLEQLDGTVRASLGNRPLIKLDAAVGGRSLNRADPNIQLTVSVPYTPAAGELIHPENIIVWSIDDNGRMAPVPNGHYDSDEGAAIFSAGHPGDFAVGYNRVNFTDVSENAWYGKAVNFIAARGITDGTGNGTYSPEAMLTRGQILVMLVKAYGIAPDAISKDNFQEDDTITRQEMLTIVYDALKATGKLPEDDTDKSLPSFHDAGQVASWAKDAVELMAKTGIVEGDGDGFFPERKASRAEMAQILYNLLSK
mgnify:CR=1 FL=1